MADVSAGSEEFVSRAEYEALNVSYKEVVSRLAQLEHDNANLHIHLLWLKKQVFGRKSEKLDLNQLMLFNPEEKTELVEAETEIEIPAHKRQRNYSRKPLPKELPRIRQEYYPEDLHCSGCQQELKRIGEEVTEELDYIPAQLVIKEHVKVKLACSRCKDGVQAGKLPPEVQPIERGRPGVGLLVYIIISKFCDHLPLYRLEQMFAREGVEIARQRMWDWLGAVAEQLTSLHQELLKSILEHPYVQADETRIEIQRAEPGGLQTGYYWSVHAPPNLVYFRYAPTRAGEIPLEIFDKYQGTVQTDLYAGYNAVFLPESCSRLACFAHVRRKFIERKGASDERANRIIKQIALLYKVESQAKGLEPEQRAELRRKKSVPLLEKLFLMIEKLNAQLLPQHPLKEATAYALKQKQELWRYVENGNFHIDNNAIERQIRPIAIGRKNYLFAGSHAGAHAASIFYSLIGTCKLNKINPSLYLADVIRRLPTHPAADIRQLLPQLWTPKQTN